MDLSSECFQKATNSTDQLHILSQEYKKLNINLDHDASDTKRVESRAIRRVKLASGLHENPEESANFEKENEDLFEDTFREKALEEKCGVFGVISNGDWPTSLDVAHIICLGLVGLQHRGQESAGIVTCKYKSEPFNVSRSEGLVSSAFSEISMMSLKGNLGIGHTRYSTSGGSGCLQLAQPFVVHTKYGTIAVAHNGELVNSSNLRETLLSHGVGLTTGGDSELITQCLSQTPPDEFKHPKFRRRVSIANKNGGEASSQQANESTDQAASASKSHQTQGNNRDNVRQPIWKADLNVDENNITSRLLYLMSLTPISYSLIVMYNECLYATRDSFGNRPLTIAMLVPPPNAGDIGSIPFSVIDNCFVEGWAISSESCPFPSIHAKLKRDVEPGEIIKFERNKMPKTLAIMPRPAKKESPAFCIFEYVYFARPDSILERQTVYSVRKLCGKRLAIESPAVKNEVDKKDFIVAPVPESSIPAALGYSQQSGIPYVEVFCKNRYVGRTFIQPSTRLRRLGVAKKFGPLTENFVGKSIILIDDSIVRGTTIGQLVRLLREAGAKEVHIRIASPPLHHPCYMGINIPTREELIANHLSPEQLALTLGAASLKYLSVEGLRESVQSGIKEKLKSDKSRVLLPEVGNVDLGLTSKFNKNFGSIKIQAPTAINANGSGKENVDSRNSSSSSSGGGKQQQSSSSATMTSQQQQQNQKQSNSNNDTTTINASFNGSHDTTQANVEAALDGDADDIAGSKEEEEREIRTKVGHCDACLTGRYPVELDEEAF